MDEDAGKYTIYENDYELTAELLREFYDAILFRGSYRGLCICMTLLCAAAVILTAGELLRGERVMASGWMSLVWYPFFCFSLLHDRNYRVKLRQKEWRALGRESESVFARVTTDGKRAVTFHSGGVFMTACQVGRVIETKSLIILAPPKPNFGADPLRGPFVTFKKGAFSDCSDGEFWDFLREGFPKLIKIKKKDKTAHVV